MRKFISILFLAILILSFIACESTQHRRFNYFMSIQDDASAQSYLETEIRRDPSNAELHFLLGKVFISTREFSSAKESFNSAAAITPQYDEDISMLLERHFRLELQSAMEAVEARNYTTALNHLQKARDIDDTREEIYPMLGYAHLQLRQTSEAETAYRSAIEINPRNSGVLYNLGELAFRQREYSTAARFAERTIAVNEEHAPAYRLRAYSYLELGYYDDAEESYYAFFQYGSSSSFQRNFAIGLYNKGEYGRAVPHLLTLTQRMTIETEILYALAESYRYLENYREMAYWYEILHRHQTEDSDIIKNLIFAYEMLGEISIAEKYHQLLNNL